MSCQYTDACQVRNHFNFFISLTSENIFVCSASVIKWHFNPDVAILMQILDIWWWHCFKIFNISRCVFRYKQSLEMGMIDLRSQLYQKSEFSTRTFFLLFRTIKPHIYHLHLSCGELAPLWPLHHGGGGTLTTAPEWGWYSEYCTTVMVALWPLHHGEGGTLTTSPQWGRHSDHCTTVRVAFWQLHHSEGGTLTTAPR